MSLTPAKSIQTGPGARLDQIASGGEGNSMDGASQSFLCIYQTGQKAIPNGELNTHSISGMADGPDPMAARGSRGPNHCERYLGPTVWTPLAARLLRHGSPEPRRLEPIAEEFFGMNPLSVKKLKYFGQSGLMSLVSQIYFEQRTRGVFFRRKVAILKSYSAKKSWHCVHRSYFCVLRNRCRVYRHSANAISQPIKHPWHTPTGSRSESLGPSSPTSAVPSTRAGALP